MKIKNILISGIAGTATMTLFSYFVSKMANKDFSEPRLLSKIEKDQFGMTKQTAHISGWVTHLGIGINWAFILGLYKRYCNNYPSPADIMKFGTLGGISAIVGWKLLFKMGAPHSSDYYEKFYSQLFITHLIFFYTVYLTMKAEEKKD